MEKKEYVIGIDLGTTNSEVAVVRDGRIEVIPVSPGVRILPSVVGVGDDGQLLIGEQARNQYLLHPERTIRSIKRRMGEYTRVTMGDKEYTPQEISAMILCHLKKVAEDHLGQEVRKAVITVPAFFSDAQRQATREAGEIAGLEVLRILNEPTAASLAYESRSPDKKTLLVYDLGGGTFDVSVVNKEGDILEVLASHGNNHLGGDDFDRKIVNRVIGYLKEKHDVDPSSNLAAMARLQRAAEAAKIALSDAPFVTISEEYLLSKDGVPIHLSLEISRHEYEEMISSHIQETLDAMHIALGSANLAATKIDEILLVGGASRTPIISRRLEEEIGLQPRIEMDPDLCVAMGAAVHAAILSGEKAPSVLIDVTPYTFGTSVLGDLDGIPYSFKFHPLIPKNTPIPVSKSEVFFTCADNQEVVDVHVYQGENPDALENIEIGKFMIEGLKPGPAGNPVIFTFSLDPNGILQVHAREKETGLGDSITIENAMRMSEAEALDQSKERIRLLFGEDGESSPEEQSPLMEEASEILEKAHTLLESASKEDQEDLTRNIALLREALAQTDEELIRMALDILSDLVYYMES